MLILYLAGNTPKPVRAEDSLSYKFEDYQEDNDRIRVVAHYLRAEKDLGINTQLGIVGLIDTITGSTPTGEPIQPDGDPDQVPLESLEDRRKSVIVDLDHKLNDHGFTFELSYSNESDYESKGGAFSYKREFNKNNTTLQMGYALLEDDLTAPTLRNPERKTSRDLFVGISQVVDPSTVLTANLSYGAERGYLGDPYKSVQKTIEILPDFFLPILFPENRPRSREKWIFYTQLQRDFASLNGSLQGSYRFFSDDANIDSHTLSLEWFQKLKDHLVLRPVYRYYRQSAADFYFHDLDQTNVIPDRNNAGNAPFYSSDHRLSKMETHSYGLKLIWFINDAWEFNVKFDRYKMKGLDGITHFSAYSDAGIFNTGLRWWF